MNGNLLRKHESSEVHKSMASSVMLAIVNRAIHGFEGYIRAGGPCIGEDSLTIIAVPLWEHQLWNPRGCR